MASWSPCSTRSISPCGTPLQLKGSWASDIVYLPHSLERTIKIAKGPLSLGLVLDADADKGINGCKVKNICNKKAVGRDGRVQVGDYIVKINAESLRNVTNSQARAILKRTNLIGTNCNIVYITSTDAKIWRERYHQDSEMQMPVINRLSPKIFPKYYRSPFVARREHSSVEHTESFDSDIVSSDAMDSRNEVPQPIFQVRPQLRHAGSIVDGSEIEKFSYDIVLVSLFLIFLHFFFL
ncbi:unnamed protein product [Dracunculus medinensis]|uniref:PDZ domain-containing protein n=1 Tax=Dracunculus medinensis TaxID=318479 RepID=A0A0N4UFD2_DRAME|nr:unnamed protein product [Dracunculus medinensis]